MYESILAAASSYTLIHKEHVQSESYVHGAVHHFGEHHFGGHHLQVAKQWLRFNKAYSNLMQN